MGGEFALRSAVLCIAVPGVTSRSADANQLHDYLRVGTGLRAWDCERSDRKGQSKPSW
jgi:hypothetical protein